VVQRASESVGASDSGLNPLPIPGYALRAGSSEYPLRKNPVVVGRASDSDLVLPTAFVSDRHAELHATETGLVVIDVGSQHGVYVNELRIANPTALLAGDRLAIGGHEFELIELQPGREGQSASAGRPPRDSSRGAAGTHAREESAISTRRAEALHQLGSVADKALALGRGQEAEHTLGAHLVAALSDATAGRGVTPDVARSSAQYAVKLAIATGKATWLDFAFRLYDALGETIPLPLVDEIYTVLRRVRGIDRALLRQYIDLLQARLDQLSLPERFVLKRLEGLEQLAARYPAS